MKNCIAFKTIAVPVMIKFTIQSLVINTQILYHQVLKEQTECF